MINISALIFSDVAKNTLASLLLKNSMPEPNTGCWFWIGDIVTGGYGRTHISGIKVLAHRASYECFVGTIPDGLTIDHKCKQPGCINPDHLEPVTMLQNTLRGTSFSKVNSEKTNCPKGHLFDYVYKDGRRGCKTCMKEAGAKRYWEKRDHVLAMVKAYYLRKKQQQ